MIAIAPAHATTVVSAVEGSMSPTQETCFQGLTTSVGDGENCMYDGGPSGVPTGTPYGEITGPYQHVAYYDSVATPAAFQTTVVGLGRVVYTPSLGDGKIAQAIAGTLSIDDNGNGFGADDLISFDITLTSPGTGSIVRVYSGSAGVDKYDSMTQVLAPTVANAVTPNGSGGFDYVIGTEGFPSVLTYADAGPCLGVAFGFADCGHYFAFQVVEPDFWSGISSAGLGGLEGNFGAKTTGTVTGIDCIDGSSTTSGVESSDCRDSQVLYSPWVRGPCAVQGGCTLKEGEAGAVRGSAEDVGWDQLLLKVSTDSAGNVVSVAGFNVDDYRVFNNTRCGDNTIGSGSYSALCNSWTSGYFTLTRVFDPDTDADGRPDAVDNCTLASNPDQCDADGDGYGNRCDGDLDNNGYTNAQDTTLYRQQLGQPSVGPTFNRADINCNGAVNAEDTTLFRQLLGSPAGPSGLMP